MKKTIELAALLKAIKILGSQQKFADAIGVSRGMVYLYIYRECRLPIKHCEKVEKLTRGEVTKEQLRPDFFK